MKEGRLFQIVYELLKKGTATAPDLAKKLEVSVRTIYRDIDALSGAGVPIYAEPGRNGGIRLMQDFVLDKIRWLEVDFSRWGGSPKDNLRFELIKSAAIHRRQIRITYASSYETITERTVYPIKLSYKSRAWYLKAYCTQKEDYRIFKLTRILDLEILEEGFSPDSFPEPDENAQKDRPLKEYPKIVLRFQKEAAYRVYDEFDRDLVERQADGDLIVSAQMPEDAWLTGFLLSFGTQVEVLKPARLRRLLAEQALKIYKAHKT